LRIEPSTEAVDEDRLDNDTPRLGRRDARFGQRRAGPQLLEECRSFGGCPTGQARITSGYRLPARYVIHAVGPRWRGGTHGEPELLASCYRESLRLAAAHGVRTIAFPAISCGIYGYPVPDAARVAIRTVADFLATEATIEKVILACFGAKVLSPYRAALREL
jgi:O-acetyl-ADP-ribose deacetylase (regulator of RNase III)